MYKITKLVSINLIKYQMYVTFIEKLEKYFALLRIFSEQKYLIEGIFQRFMIS